MPVINAFKEKLSRPGTQHGCWIMSASPLVAELHGYVGFDFAVIDTEHAPVGLSGLVSMLQALGASGATAPVVRPPSHDPTLVKQYLDIGAQSLMFPYVENARQAKDIVASAMYPPQGFRGMARMTRASRFNTVADYTQTANDQVCIIAQLETPQAMENAQEIVLTPGVDAVFIGPGDLSANMGVTAMFEDKRLIATMENVFSLCRQLGKASGTVCPTAKLAGWAKRAGANYVAVSNDLADLMRSAKGHLAELAAG
jgi:2-keto-3-deoxy-L-rhamnonate aldolase RhmA